MLTLKQQPLNAFTRIVIHRYTSPYIGPDGRDRDDEFTTIREGVLIEFALQVGWHTTKEAGLDGFLHECTIAKKYLEFFYVGPKSTFRASWERGLKGSCEFVIEDIETRPKMAYISGKSYAEQAVRALTEYGMI